MHVNFKNQVKSARGDKLKGPESKLFSGQVWVGQDAVDIGLVDGIDTMHKFIAKEFGTEKVTVKKITQKAKFPASLFGANLQSEDFSTSPFVTTAFAHQVAAAFMQEKSPLDDIQL